MKGKGQALCHGAISILNAFATGKGGALGIDLWTRARVTLEQASRNEFKVNNTSEPNDSDTLVIQAVRQTLEYYAPNSLLSGTITTWSIIPSAVGLKSSSAVSNAVVLATVSALGIKSDDETIINIAATSSVVAGTSLTGAYDDAYATYHGGGVITDNVQRRVEKKFNAPSDTSVILLIPPRKRLTGSIAKKMFDPVHGLAEIAYREACDSNVWNAMSLNGLAYSLVLGEDQQPVLEALRSGAFAAGLSGKGPAIAALVERTNLENVRRSWQRFEGLLIETSPNIRKAEVEI